MKQVLTLIISLSFALTAFGQKGNTFDYSDVVVLVNANDNTSQAIGNYYKNARNIPAQNVIPTATPPAREQIDSLTFEILLNEIRDSLNARNLDTGVNYLVTTKGMPLGVSRDTTNYYAGVPYSPFNASLESELALMNSPAESFIGDSLAIGNPYAGVKQHHDKSTHGIYLVSRLDGYNLEDIKSMIDNSGPYTIVDRDSAKFILDQDPSKGNNALNTRMDTAHRFLQNRNWQSVNDRDTTYLTQQSNVLGYYSWGSNDQYQSHYTQNGTPNNDWEKGSFAAMNVSTSARSFDTSTSYGQSLIADLIANGNTGGAGYVYEPFAWAIVHMDTFLARYTSQIPDEPYTMGESYFMASPAISWMDVLIGDPKTSIMACNEVTVSAGNDTFTCRNRPIELSAKSNITGASFKWEGMTTNFSDSGPTIAFNPDTSQSYLLTMTKDQCVKRDTIDVQLFPKPFEAGKDTLLCYNENLQLNPDVPDSNATFHWTPESLFTDPSQPNPTISPDTTSTITLEVIQNNCLMQDSFEVRIETSPVYTVDQITLCRGDTMTLHATMDTFRNGQFQWTPTDHIDNAQAQYPRISPDSSATYYVQLSNDYCTTKDSTFVHVRQPVNADFGFTINTSSVTFFDSAQNADTTRWNLGDGNFSKGAAPFNFNHAYGETDTFEVCQEVWNTCFTDTACRTIVTETTGNVEKSREKVLKIYPNPVEEALWIESKTSELNGSFRLLDNQGKIVLEKQGRNTQRKLQLDVSRLKEGLYYLEGGQLNQRYKILIR